MTRTIDDHTLEILLDIIHSLETGEELQTCCNYPIPALLSLKAKLKDALNGDPVVYTDW